MVNILGYNYSHLICKDSALLPSLFLSSLKIICTCQDTVNAICDDEDIRAVSFVGSNTVSKYICCYSFIACEAATWVYG